MIELELGELEACKVDSPCAIDSSRGELRLSTRGSDYSRVSVALGVVLSLPRDRTKVSGGRNSKGLLSCSMVVRGKFDVDVFKHHLNDKERKSCGSRVKVKFRPKSRVCTVK